MKVSPGGTIQWWLRLLMALMVLGWVPVLAEPVVWNGNTDGDWNNADNWDGLTPPRDADVAVFHADGAGNLALSLSADTTVDGLEFNANATNPVTIALDATHPLRLGGGASIDNLVTTGSHLIDGDGALPIDRPGEVTTFHDGSSSLFLDSDAAIGVTAGSTLLISQNVTGIGLGSSLDKVGAGELILASADSSAACERLVRIAPSRRQP